MCYALPLPPVQHPVHVRLTFVVQTCVHGRAVPIPRASAVPYAVFGRIWPPALGAAHRDTLDPVCILLNFFIHLHGRILAMAFLEINGIILVWMALRQSVSDVVKLDAGNLARILEEAWRLCGDGIRDFAKVRHPLGQTSERRGHKLSKQKALLCAVVSLGKKIVQLNPLGEERCLAAGICVRAGTPPHEPVHDVLKHVFHPRWSCSAHQILIPEDEAVLVDAWPAQVWKAWSSAVLAVVNVSAKRVCQQNEGQSSICKTCVHVCVCVCACLCAHVHVHVSQRKSQGLGAKNRCNHT